MLTAKFSCKSINAEDSYGLTYTPRCLKMGAWVKPEYNEDRYGFA